MATMIDPVCGQQLDDQQSAITSSYLNCTYFFCSLGCKEQFDLDPASYAIEPAQGALPEDQTLAGQGSMGQAALDPEPTDS
jgi:P-type Cu+ transporter